MKPLFALAVTLVFLAGVAPAGAENAPGVTATEIKIGQTAPYSGLGSPLASSMPRIEMAYFHMINDQGGINGRKINLISLDDRFNPAQTLELTKKLVEEERVALIFGTTGGPQNAAIRPYLNEQHVPQLFIASTSEEAADPKQFPWTVGGMPIFRIEAQIFGRYMLVETPAAKVAVLYQNDEFGLTYLNGLKEGMRANYANRVVGEAHFEENGDGLDQAITALKDTGADAVLLGVSPPYAVRTLGKIDALDWHPIRFIASPSSSIGLLETVGLDKLKGLVTAASYMDPSDPRWTEDGSLKPYNELLDKYMPGGKRDDLYYVFGYVLAQALVQTLKQCGDDLSRENILAQATNLKDFHPVGLLPGVGFFTSHGRLIPIVEAAMEQFDGQYWKQVGDVMAGH